MLACVNDHIEFSKVIVDEENMFKFKDSSLPEKSRDLVLHEGDLNLSNYSWQFGRTPAHLGTIGSSNLDEFLEKLRRERLPQIGGRICFGVKSYFILIVNWLQMPISNESEI